MLLTTNEVARILRCTTPTVRRLIKDGELKAISVGAHKRIDSAQLSRFLSNDNDKKGGGRYASTHDKDK